MYLLKNIKQKLSSELKYKLKARFNGFKAFCCSSDLNKLAQIFKTDKFGGHYYTQHYQNHFSPFRKKRLMFWKQV